MKITLAILALSACLSLHAATTRYVRAGATGAANGTSWDDAYTSLPAVLVRGDTYFVADGTYSGYTFNDAVSGSLVTTVKKATVADHGTETGWDNSYGDGQAVFTGQTAFEVGGYIVLDGNGGSSTNYGFWFGRLKVGDSDEPILTNLVIRSVQADPNGGELLRALQIKRIRDLTIQWSRFGNSDNDGVATETLNDFLMEHCHIGPRKDGGFGTHADAFELRSTANATLRYCTTDWNGQHMFFSTPNHGTWYVYGNVFYGGITSGKGMDVHETLQTVTIYAYNNTFNDLNVGMSLLTNSFGGATNNVFHNITAASIGFGLLAHDYNWFETGLSTGGEANAQTGSDPFVSEAGNDYRLSRSLPGGFALASPYDTDPLGQTRGVGGVWDMGAYVYTAPSPSRLHVNGRATVTGELRTQ